MILQLRTLGLLALVPAPLVAQETYGFVARLGNDTTSIERITRTAGRVVSDLVEKAPRVIRRHWEATLAPDGSIRHWTMDMAIANSAPNRPSTFHYVVDFDADSVHASIREGDSSRTVTLKTTFALTMPWDSFIYGAYELLFAAAVNQAGDSVPVGQYFPGYEPIEGGIVRKLKDGSLTFVTTGLSGTGSARLDARGRMLSYSGRNTTYKQEVERVSQGPDIERIAARFAAREKAAGVTRALSGRDTVRATVGSSALLIDYSRPVARSRVILGSVVPCGEVWRTGANAATQFSTSAPITVAGMALAAGTYTLWTVPTKGGAELIINRQSKQWGTQYDSSRNLGRAALVTEVLSQPVDTFAIRVERGGAGGGTLVFEWDRFRWTAPIAAPAAPERLPGRAVNRAISALTDAGRSVLRFDERPEAGILWFPDLQMDDGVIEFDVRGRDVQQRSFLGVTFRQVDDSTWDSVWLRPFNFRGVDSAHHAHALQYASYPAHSWQQLRETHPGQYEAAVESVPDPAGWVHARIEIARSEVRVFVNGALRLQAPELSGRTGGAVGLWVGACSPGDFASVVVTPHGGPPVSIGLPAVITTTPGEGATGTLDLCNVPR